MKGTFDGESSFGQRCRWVRNRFYPFWKWARICILLLCTQWVTLIHNQATVEGLLQLFSGYCALPWKFWWQKSTIKYLSLHICYFHRGRTRKCQVLSKETIPAMTNILSSILLGFPAPSAKTQNFHCQELESTCTHAHTLGTLFYFAKKKGVFIYKPFHSLSKHSTTIQLFAPSVA